VDHLVQHGVLDLGPRMAEDVAAADGDLGGTAGPEVHGELTQPGPHPAGQPDRNGAKQRAEMLPVEPLVDRGEVL
jgi:hypothetical protein